MQPRAADIPTFFTRRRFQPDIFGENKFLYDLWGDAVNTASRMESHGEAGMIHVSDEFRIAVETGHSVETRLGTSLRFVERGELDIKGKGIMRTYFLERG